MAAVKTFDEFSINEDFSLEGILTHALPLLGDSFAQTIRQKIVATLMEKLGIEDKSTLSVMLQEFVSTIPFSDLPGIISGDKANAEYFVPKLAEFIPRFFQRKGIDTIAASLGINSTGWLYSTLRNMLETDLGKQNLNKFLTSLFGVDPGHSMGKSIVSKLDPQEKEKMADAIQNKDGSSDSDSGIAGFLSGLMGGHGNTENSGNQSYNPTTA